VGRRKKKEEKTNNRYEYPRAEGDFVQALVNDTKPLFGSWLQQFVVNYQISDIEDPILFHSKRVQYVKQQLPIFPCENFVFEIEVKNYFGQVIYLSFDEQQLQNLNQFSFPNSQTNVYQLNCPSNIERVYCEQFGCLL